MDIKSKCFKCNSTLAHVTDKVLLARWETKKEPGILMYCTECNRLYSVQYKG